MRGNKSEKRPQTGIMGRLTAVNEHSLARYAGPSYVRLRSLQLRPSRSWVHSFTVILVASIGHEVGVQISLRVRIGGDAGKVVLSMRDLASWGEGGRLELRVLNPAMIAGKSDSDHLILLKGDLAPLLL